MDKEALEILAKLRSGIAIKEAQIMSNPLPYLKEAERSLSKAREVFEDVDRALSPDIVFDIAIEHNIPPMTINGEAYARCEAAKKVIKKYLKGEHN